MCCRTGRLKFNLPVPSQPSFLHCFKLEWASGAAEPARIPMPLRPSTSLFVSLVLKTIQVEIPKQKGGYYILGCTTLGATQHSYKHSQYSERADSAREALDNVWTGLAHGATSVSGPNNFKTWNMTEKHCTMPLHNVRHNNQEKHCTMPLHNVRHNNQD